MFALRNIRARFQVAVLEGPQLRRARRPLWLIQFRKLANHVWNGILNVCPKLLQAGRCTAHVVNPAAPSAEITAPTSPQLHACLFGGARGTNRGIASRYETPIINRRIPFMAEAQSDVAAGSQAAAVGPEQRAVREAPARPPQGAVQVACGVCEGLVCDASRSGCVQAVTLMQGGSREHPGLGAP
jgi:hypothetical protein